MDALPYHKEHLELAQAARANGSLVMASNPADLADGATFVFKVRI